MAIKTGAAVRLIQPVLEGVVLDRRINKATDEIECLVQWTEAGERVQRWLDAKQLEEVQP